MFEFLKALHNAVLDNNAKVVSEQMRLSHTGLLGRANPDHDGSSLKAEHVYEILQYTQDMRPLAVLAAAFGFDLVPREEAKPQALTMSLLTVSKEVAELTVAVHAALEDGFVSATEKKTIAQEIEHVREGLRVMAVSVKSA
ncbi:phage regulatory CII family protein [Pseudomonas sp. B26(2017)]|uniref:phage regulatory CII family protein n=1 Tax=Pseudomonas sp. B26(2017) TaxID=1981732 RepID=UPI000A1FAB1A|nr:phage regulatory CII family protein [Pseudomonas sp. B26(2017)]